MLRRPTQDGITQASRRPLKIFASDPLLGRTFGNRARIDIANEPLQEGPVGSRLEVIDYDGAQKCFYSPVNLDNPAILMQGGLEPSESDPRFHQQMVYAVALKTLENFDRALGRVLRLGSHNRKRGTTYPRLRLQTRSTPPVSTRFCSATSRRMRRTWVPIYPVRPSLRVYRMMSSLTR